MERTLVLLSGLPGTGKSTLARLIADRLGAHVLAIDDLTEGATVEALSTTAFWDGAIVRLLEAAATALRGGSVVLDSVFMDLDRFHARDLAGELGARFLPVHTFCSDERLWERRVTERYETFGDLGIATWDRVQRQRLGFRPWEAGTAVFVDAVDLPHENLSKVMSEGEELRALLDVPYRIGDYHHWPEA